MLLQFASLIVMVGTVIAGIKLWQRGRGGQVPQNAEHGTLYLTGVSPRPDATGEQYVTITGNLTGPSVTGEIVSGRFAWDVEQWPSIGDLFDVVYPAGKPQHWQLSAPGARPYFGS